MNDATQILQLIESGDSYAAEDLLPLVYDELRKLAVTAMANEAADQTLQPTALVHEAYLRLVDTEKAQHWDSRRHFFAAAAESMRRILVENARRKGREKHGGKLKRIQFDEQQVLTTAPPDSVVALDEALTVFEQVDPDAAKLVKLRYFVGMTLEEAANSLGVSERTAYRDWSYARGWLFRFLRERGHSVQD